MLNNTHFILLFHLRVKQTQFTFSEQKLILENLDKKKFDILNLYKDLYPKF